MKFSNITKIIEELGDRPMAINNDLNTKQSSSNVL